ncbi:MAG: FGGY-family carbohydrate kinase [Pseudomonadota bacterium]
MDTLYLGIDVGTSGVRSCIIDETAAIRAGASTPLPAPGRMGAAVEQDPEIWWTALTENLEQLRAQRSLAPVAAITLDGTSSTLLCCDASGRPLGPALMYNDARATREAQRIAGIAPPDCAAHGPSASLAKLLWLQQSPFCKYARHILHQADWLLGRLCGHFGTSDENNALKLGYDVIQRRWPDWLQALDVPMTLLPTVVPAGHETGTLAAQAGERWGLSTDTRILAGTTDSTASFIATGAGPGDAVTSLGSTLVLKVLADQPVFAPAYGIYSHRLGDRWLVGGASNTGGAVLKAHFTAAEIEQFAALINPDETTGLDYYPLLADGERFPVNDPALAPRLQPRPADDVLFYQGILEGIANIEVRGYQKLAELGAPWPKRIMTTGGGAANAPWRKMRSRLTGIPVTAATHQEAAYGAALLSLKGSS